MSHLLLQLYPLSVSFNSNMLTILSILSSFPFHLYLAVSATSSGVSSLHSWFIHNSLGRNPTKTEAICFGTSHGSSPNFVSTLLLFLVIFDMLALLCGIPSLNISSYTVFKSNLKTHRFSGASISGS